MKPIKPNVDDYVILASDDWYVWTGEAWRPMTAEEQIEASL